MRRIIFIAGLLCIACEPDGSTTPEVTATPEEASPTPEVPTPAATPLPVPEPGEGIQLKSAVLTVAPGEDLTLCTYINGAISETSAVNGSIAQQGIGGHHIVVYETDGEKPEGVEPCYESSSGMVDGSMVLGNFLKGNRTAYPDGLAVKIEPQNSLIVDSHYINTTDHTIEVQDVINLFFIPMDEVTAFLGSYMLANFDINVQPGSEYSTTATCTVPMDMDAVLMMGHQHEWGTQINIDHTPLGGSTVNLYRGLPTVTDPTQAGMLFYYDAPLALRRGDEISWQCDWFNDTDHVLAWPEEMCTVVFTYYPEAPQQIVCARSVENL